MNTHNITPHLKATKIDIAGTQYIDAGAILIPMASISYVYSSRDTRRLLDSDELITPVIVVFNNGHSIYVKSTVDELQLKLFIMGGL